MKVLCYGSPGLIADVLPDVLAKAGHEVIRPTGAPTGSRVRARVEIRAQTLLSARA